MKYTKKAAPLIAAMVFLSACGNGEAAPKTTSGQNITEDTTTSSYEIIQETERQQTSATSSEEANPVHDTVFSVEPLEWDPDGSEFYPYSNVLFDEYIRNGEYGEYSRAFNGRVYFCIANSEITIPGFIEAGIPENLPADIAEKFDGVQIRSVGNGSNIFDGGSITSSHSDDVRQIRSITVSQGIELIDGAFIGCENLSEVKLPDSLLYIDNAAFYECSSLESIDLPDNPLELNDDSFARSGLKSVTIPANTKFVSTVINQQTYHGAFVDCPNLTQVTLECIPVSEIGKAFHGSPVKTVILAKTLLNNNNGLPPKDWNYFVKYFDGVEEIILPEDLTIICRNFYSECESLTKIDNIPASVTDIEGYAFSDCVNLEEIKLPDGIKSIGDRAFDGCEKLEEITLPKELETIGSHAFDGTALKSIVVPDNVKVLNNTFYGCKNLASVTLPDNLEVLEGTFSECTSLETIKLPDSLKNINSAFENCTSLNGISLPDSIKDIGGAFKGCTSLNEIILPDSVKDIDSAFSGCTSLKSVKMPDGITDIGSEAFNGCISLTDINIPNSIEKIETNAFKGCKNLTSVTLPDSIKFVDKNAFKDCDNMTISYKGKAYTNQDLRKLSDDINEAQQ